MKPLFETRICIVEDNFVYSYVLSEMLSEYENFKVTTIQSGEECIEIINKNTPDLIILDYNLEKKMTGLDTLRAIRSQKPKIPVIILSSQPDVQVAANLLKEGAFDYIQKKNNMEAMNKIKSSIFKALNK